MGSGRGGPVKSLRRMVVTLFFMFTMMGSLLVSSRPLFVSLADVVVLLLSTMVGCSSCLFSVSDWRVYSFKSSLIDIPLLSLIRSFIVICAYSLCSSPNSYNPYFGVTVVCGLASAAFLIVKAAIFSLDAIVSPTVYQEVQRMKNSWALPFLFLSSISFGFAHVIVAHRARYQARRKLLFRWEDEEALLVEKEHPRSFSPKTFTKMTKVLEGKYHKRRESDLPASLLADADSLFMTCNNILVHYKLVEGHQSGVDGFQDTENSVSSPARTSPKYTPLLSISSNDFSETPAEASYPIEQVLNGCHEILGGNIMEMPEAEIKVDVASGRNGVVLIHGFGGGVFSWRHVMSPLARQTRCTVVAFDRPGWGLTSRPSRSEWEKKGIANPYELQAQVDLLFAFCEELGLRSVVLVGHDDGGLLALMAAAKASKSKNTCKVVVKGVVLVGVSLSREVVPSFARVLLHTSLGRQMLRPLLRSEIGQVANRRAWHDASKLTSDILDLYKAPLRVEGWDQALAEVTKSSASSILQSTTAAELLQTVGNLPALLVAGLQDMLVPLKAAQSLATKLPQSKLIAIPGCGHLPPEECPGALLAAMLPFISSLFDANDPL